MKSFLMALASIPVLSGCLYAGELSLCFQPVCKAGEISSGVVAPAVPFPVPADTSARDRDLVDDLAWERDYNDGDRDDVTVESLVENEYMKHQILPEADEAVLRKAKPGTAPAGAPLVIGHRGYGEKTVPEPESSLPALRKGFALGAAALEFDVQLSKDQELMLTHNSDVDEVSTSKGCVADYDRAQLQSMVLLDGKKHHSKERMMTMEEVLPLFRSQAESSSVNGGSNVVAVVHIKVFDGFHGDFPGIKRLLKPCPKTDHALIAKKVLASLEEAGLADRVVFEAFDYRVLDLIRSERPSAKLGLLSLRSAAIAAAASKKYDIVSLYYPSIQHKDVLLARKYGLKVYAWSPAKKKTINKIATEHGKVGKVDGIITNSIPNALDCVGAH